MTKKYQTTVPEATVLAVSDQVSIAMEGQRRQFASSILPGVSSPVSADGRGAAVAVPARIVQR